MSEIITPAVNQIDLLPKAKEAQEEFNEFREIFSEFLEKITNSSNKGSLNIDELNNIFKGISDGENVKLTYRNIENMEGSFYFKDIDTNNEIRFRIAGTMGNHIYLRDGENKEKLFFNGLDNDNLGTSLRRIDNKSVVLNQEGGEGIDVVYMSKEDNQQSKNDFTTLFKKKEEVDTTFNKFFQRAKIKRAKKDLENYHEKHSDTYKTEENIPKEQVERLLENFGTIFANTKEVLSRY